MQISSSRSLITGLAVLAAVGIWLLVDGDPQAGSIAREPGNADGTGDGEGVSEPTLRTRGETPAEPLDPKSAAARDAHWTTVRTEGPGARGDPAFKTWLAEFVKRDLAAPPPSGYRGSKLAWRLHPPSPVALGDYKRLIGHFRALAPADRRALLGRVILDGSLDVGRQLASAQETVADATALTHAMYGETLISVMDRERVKRRTPGRNFRRTPKPDLSDLADMILATIRSEIAFVRARGKFAEASSWRAIETKVRKLGQRHSGYAELPEVQDAWMELLRLLLAPLAPFDPRAPVPRYMELRVRIFPQIESLPSAADVMATLEAWPEVRRWLASAKGAPKKPNAPGILNTLIVLAWRHGDERVRTQLVAWLERAREGRMLIKEELSKIRSSVKDLGLGGIPPPSPAARREFAAWR